MFCIISIWYILMPTNANSTPVKTACVIVAGGSGTRLGGGEPKQFMLLGRKPLICWSVEYFGNHPAVHQVVVVVPAGWEERTALLLSEISIYAPLKIVRGGQRRQDSVLAGIMAAGESDVVAIHDGARPFPPDNLESAVAESLRIGGAIFALPATDSIKAVNENLIEKTVPREGLWAAQTPQVFLRDKLIAALKTCDEIGAEITDDASAFERMGWPVTVVPGSRQNLKVTYPEDFTMAEAILKGRS